MNNRRKLIIALGAGALTAPLAALAQQQPNKVPRIAFLSGRGSPTAANPDPNADAFREGLRDLGYVEGKNILIEYRYAGGVASRGLEFVAELVQLKVDVLVSPYFPAIRAAKIATNSIPIVMITTADPVASGFVESLAHPGGNITGITRLTEELGAKRLQLLKDVIPRVSRIGVIWNDDDRNASRRLKNYEEAARTLKLQILPLPIRGTNPDLAGAIQAAVDGRVSAIIVTRSPLLLAHQKELFALLNKNRLPSICEGREEAQAGGLLSYAASDAASFRRAAVYLDKILRGAKPANLPVEQPTTFELVINMQTANALGIKFPNSILISADKVIE